MSRSSATLDRHSVRSARRLVTLGVVFALVAAAMVARLVDVQVLQPEGYVEYGARNRTVLRDLAATRGPIFDRNVIPLAVSVQARTIWADPALIADPVDTALQLGNELGIAATPLVDRLSDPDSRFAYIVRQVDDATVERVRALELPGVFDSPEPRRDNPSGDGFAAALLGQAGVDNDGISGLEMQYAELLAGEPGQLIVESGAASHGRPTIVGGEYHLDPAVPGDGLVLTIDRGLQYEVEQRLSAWVDETRSDFGVVIIMDTATGELLSVANVGASETGPARPVRENRAFTWLYEPGSISKTLTFAGLIEAGIVAPSTMISVPPTLTVYDAEFEDHPYHDEEMWTATRILALSSNVGSIKFADMGGSDLLYDTLVDFGVLDSTGLGFPGEASGILPSVDDWSGVSRATIAIGQGVAATPLRWIAAYNTIANDGLYVEPTLVRGAMRGEGTFEPFETAEPERVISEQTARSVTTMLEQVVVDENGTGRLAEIPGFDIAGKTGTAEKPQPGGGYLAEDGYIDYVSSFAGFLPADDPQVTILVVMDNPAGSQSEASQSAAPLFDDLALQAIRHRQIAQPGAVDPDSERVRALSAVEVAAAALDEAG